MKRLMLVSATVAMGLAAQAQIISINNATSFTYTQDFNTLAVSGSGNSWNRQLHDSRLVVGRHRRPRPEHVRIHRQ